ncbi:uncharacterized protein LOC135199494 [Macrobrachium nipponense]|uniref:uncharacterized protein LOC135199494 n=1 Tax=Macrobrachium nipponense TaxID=159736 RepID=UPI0030C80BE8
MRDFKTPGFLVIVVVVALDALVFGASLHSGSSESYGRRREGRLANSQDDSVWLASNALHPADIEQDQDRTHAFPDTDVHRGHGAERLRHRRETQTPGVVNRFSSGANTAQSESAPLQRPELKRKKKLNTYIPPNRQSNAIPKGSGQSQPNSRQYDYYYVSNGGENNEDPTAGEEGYDYEDANAGGSTTEGGGLGQQPQQGDGADGNTDEEYVDDTGDAGGEEEGQTEVFVPESSTTVSTATTKASNASPGTASTTASSASPATSTTASSAPTVKITTASSAPTVKITTASSTSPVTSSTASSSSPVTSATASSSSPVTSATASSSSPVTSATTATTLAATSTKASSSVTSTVPSPSSSTTTTATSSTSAGTTGATTTTVANPADMLATAASFPLNIFTTVGSYTRGNLWLWRGQSSGELPVGQSNVNPFGQMNNVPSQSSNTFGQIDNSFGQVIQGQTSNGFGQVNYVPSQASNAFGQANYEPGQTSNAFGQVSYVPSQTSNPFGQINYVSSQTSNPFSQTYNNQGQSSNLFSQMESVPSQLINNPGPSNTAGDQPSSYSSGSPSITQQRGFGVVRLSGRGRADDSGVGHSQQEQNEAGQDEPQEASIAISSRLATPRRTNAGGLRMRKMTDAADGNAGTLKKRKTKKNKKKRRRRKKKKKMERVSSTTLQPTSTSTGSQLPEVGENSAITNPPPRELFASLYTSKVEGRPLGAESEGEGAVKKRKKIRKKKLKFITGKR